MRVEAKPCVGSSRLAEAYGWEPRICQVLGASVKPCSYLSNAYVHYKDEIANRCTVVSTRSKDDDSRNHGASIVPGTQKDNIIG
jgi:hypothetical protein